MTPEERAVIERLFSIAPALYTIRPSGNVGLVIVNPVCGFTRAGNLADPEHMVFMAKRIRDIILNLNNELGSRLHVLVLLDTHEADIPEPPYPPHCIQGTGEEEIDPELAFLFKSENRSWLPSITAARKNCINGFIGSMARLKADGWKNEIWTEEMWSLEFVQWMKEYEITTLLVVGDCTDICVSDLVVTSLSARNHGMFTSIDPNDDRAAYVAAISGMDIVVLEFACETFDAPAIGHDREAWHHIGLAIMASRGAILASEITVG